MRSKPQIALNSIMLILSIVCIAPLVLLISSSFSDNLYVIRYGYSFIPKKFSLGAYSYLMNQADYIFRAYFITVFITVVGTTVSLFVTTMLAYCLSRRDLPGNKFFTFFVFFTLLFNGGLVPTYLLYTQIIQLKNTIYALLIPYLLLNGFNVLLARTFFTTDIPIAIIESANIDGANEFTIYTKIILPLSLPIMATLGLFIGIGYWNDWYNGLIYITDTKLYSLQNVLNQILLNVQFILQHTSAASHIDTSKIPSETVRMAIAVVGVVPILFAYPFFQKYFVKGIVMGAVKE
jgi:putative aldouronate transport system permease protein